MDEIVIKLPYIGPSTIDDLDELTDEVCRLANRARGEAERTGSACARLMSKTLPASADRLTHHLYLKGHARDAARAGRMALALEAAWHRLRELRGADHEVAT